MVPLAQPCACQSYGFGDGLDGLLLAHDPLVELFFKLEELLALLLRELRHGDAREGAYNFSNMLGAHLGRLRGGGPAPPLLLLLQLLLLLLELFLKLLGAVELLAGSGVVHLALQLLNFGFQLLKLGGPRRRQDAHPGRGLVDEIDRLVRQVAIRDVTVGELRRGHDRLVRDLHLVVGLEAIS